MSTGLNKSTGFNKDLMTLRRFSNGEVPEDLFELCLELGAHMAVYAGCATDRDDAREKLIDAVNSKKALNKLAELVKAQHGDERAVYNKELLPKASIIREIIAEEEGYVSRIICDNVGLSAMVLGGGRENKDSIIDLSVGIVLHKKKGDYVKVGDSIATFYANDEKKLVDGIERFKGAYIIDKSAPDKKTLIQYIVTDKELLSFI